MAAGFFSPPGHPAGPCKGRCDHDDCAYIRDSAQIRCTICNRPIGYDTRFYRQGAVFNHALCEERKIERKRQVMPVQDT
jgi:hypothetical protein